MKCVPTLMLVLAFGISASYSRVADLELASPGSQQFVEQLVDGIDDMDADFDETMHKIRLLKSMISLMAEADSKHQKRFIFDDIKKVVDKVAEKVTSALNALMEQAEYTFNKITDNRADIKRAAKRLMPLLKSKGGMKACEAIVVKFARRILKSASPVARTAAKPLCKFAIAELDKQLSK